MRALLPLAALLVAPSVQGQSAFAITRITVAPVGVQFGGGLALQAAGGEMRVAVFAEPEGTSNLYAACVAEACEQRMDYTKAAGVSAAWTKSYALPVEKSAVFFGAELGYLDRQRTVSVLPSLRFQEGTIVNAAAASETAERVRAVEWGPIVGVRLQVWGPLALQTELGVGTQYALASEDPLNMYAHLSQRLTVRLR